METQSRKRFRLAPIFSDGCILQRDQDIVLFGAGVDGTHIDACVEGFILETGVKQISTGNVTVENGRFEIVLPPLKEGIHHKIVLSDDKEQICLQDVAIGEVWLAGGQSNMEFELINCKENAVLQEGNDEWIRFYYTLKTGEINDAFLEKEEQSHWEKFGDQGTGHWSAVGTFFARKLKEKLKVPVGVIGCNLGGTSASAWMPDKLLRDDEQLSIYTKLFARQTAGISEEKQKADYDAYQTKQIEYDKKRQELMQEKPGISEQEILERLGPNRWPGPMGVTNPYRPGGLYECMLKRIAPYSIRGVLFYQGESDEFLPNLYERLFTKMMTSWRHAFKKADLPFIYALLPVHQYESDPDFKQWCIIREAQCDVAENVDNAFVVNIIDQGEYNNIHPIAKQMVGERMCKAALSEIYHMLEKNQVYGPKYESCQIQDNKMILQLSGIEDGLYVAKNKQTTTNKLAGEKGKENAFDEIQNLPGFEIAGIDQKYQPADAVFQDKNIIVSNPQVTKPLYARYLWTNYTDTFLYGANGLPVYPFRTSREDGFVPQLKEDIVKNIMGTEA